MKAMLRAVISLLMTVIPVSGAHAGDVERGRAIAHGGGFNDPMACFRCHGLAGEGDAASAAPRLAGLSAYYMAKQMRDFAGGTRPDPIMTPIARALSAQAQVDVSAYYAVLAATRAGGGGDGGDDELGQLLAERGAEERGLPPCRSCHGRDGKSPAPAIPSLAGQHASYIARQLRLWRQGERANDPLGGMTRFAGRLTETEIDAVARWFASRGPEAP